jgi:MFS family permease
VTETPRLPMQQHRAPLPRAVWLLSVVSFLADVSSEMVYPLLPLFLVGVLGASKASLGLIEGAAVLIVALMSAFAGSRSDQLKRRVPWIRWGYGLPVLGKSVIALATVWPLVLAGRLLDRFGKGLRGAPRDALIADVVAPDQRGRAFGLHRMFDTAGALLGVLLSAFLLWWLTGAPQETVESAAHSTAQTPAWVYRAVFGVGAVLGLASLLFTFLVAETEAPKDGGETSTAIGSTVPATSSNASDAARAASAQAGWLGLPRSYWLVLTVLVLFSLANSSDTFLLLRASELGYSPWAVVLAYALYNSAYAALSYSAGVLSDQFGRWAIIALGWAIYAVTYAGFALLPPSLAWGIWPLMAIYGVYMALTDGVGKALLSDHAPREKRGTAMGVFYGLTGLTTLCASLIAGVAWDRSGPTTALAIGAGFAVLALLVLPFIIRRSAA